MPNMSIMVDYDLMDENTADPMYLEYITQRKAYLHYTLLNHKAELAECHENNRKVEDAIQAHIGDLDNLEYYGDTKATASFKMILYRLEELKAVKVDFDRITDEVERLIKYLKTEVGELEVEVEYNEQLVDEAEARQMEEYDAEINEKYIITNAPFHPIQSEEINQHENAQIIKKEEEDYHYKNGIKVEDVD